MIVAQIGLTMGAISNTVYAVVLTMVVATTLIAPLFIKPAFKHEQAAARDIDYKAATEYSEA